MSKVGLLFCMLIVVTLPFSAFSVAAERNNIEIGDYWEYLVNALLPGSIANISFTYRIEIADENTKIIDGISSPVLVGKIAIGDSSPTSGGFTGTGIAVFVKSNFSLVSTSITTKFILFNGYSTVLIHSEEDYNPPFDRYVGDDNLSVGTRMTSSTTITSSGWTDFGGLNTTMPVTTSFENVTLEVVASNVSVTVPAGTFDCYRIQITTNGTSSFWYYSDRVGNYVKMEESSSVANGVIELASDMQLLRFSYGDTGRTLSIHIIAIVGGVIAVAIAAGVVTILHKRKMQRQEAAASPPLKEAQPESPQTPLSAKCIVEDVDEEQREGTQPP